MAEFKPFGWVFVPKMKGITLIEVEKKPVVFCRDCKHRFENLRCYADNPMRGQLVGGDWYCADGERKEGR